MRARQCCPAAQSLDQQHGGEAGLDALPCAGTRIAAAIAELLGSGRWQQWERLRGEADPDALFRTIPGVGAGLARRLHEELGVQTLEALAPAANEGRREASCTPR